MMVFAKDRFLRIKLFDVLSAENLQSTLLKEVYFVYCIVS